MISRSESRLNLPTANVLRGNYSLRRMALTLATLSVSLFALDASKVHISGRVLGPDQQPMAGVSVRLVPAGAVLSDLRTNTDAQGRYVLGEAPAALRPSLGKAWSGKWNGVIPQGYEARALGVDGRIHALPGALPAGAYVVQLRQLGVNKAWEQPQMLNNGAATDVPSTARAALAKGELAGYKLHFARTGFLRKSVAVGGDLGELMADVALVRDPLEDRIDSVMEGMTLKEKVGQMTQAGWPTISTTQVRTLGVGSVLSGGGDAVAGVNSLQTYALSSTSGIPLMYGIDAVHGNSKFDGTVIFPHNIGLGATRDTNLVRRIGEVTAKEVLGKGVDWTFSPCIAVPQDERWGRTYEGFGEDPTLVASMGAALIRGLQGPMFDAPWLVAANAKHFVADGGTKFGTSTAGFEGSPPGLLDQGDAQITELELRTIHLPPYEAAIHQGVLTVMASYSSWNGARAHGNKTLLTDILKEELAFDGMIVSDWEAIKQIDPTYSTAVRKAIDAGIDMAMEPTAYGTFQSYLESFVNAGTIPMTRIDDAVRRILRTKFRMGRMDNPTLATTYATTVGSAEHRAIAREAVRKSAVLLKNQAIGPNFALPLGPTASVALHGAHADNAGLMAGGWTISWQGGSQSITGATTLRSAMQAAAETPTNILTGYSTPLTPANVDVAVIVGGEDPYAEFFGDKSDLAIPANLITLAKAYKTAGKPVVFVLVSGRPMILGEMQTTADAIVAAWLPGTEATGLADILYGLHKPTGKLPHTWPEKMSDIPIRTGDGKVPLYPYGHGLTYP